MISGVILAHNEENNIVACIEALRPHVTELLLIDTESSDRTRELATPLVNRVLSQPNSPNFDAIRNLAIPAAKYDWLWFVDADERVPLATGKLVNELIATQGHHFEAICIPFKTYFCSQWMRHCGWWPGYTCPRVLKRGYFEFSPTLHGGVLLDGREVRVPPDPTLAIEHESYRSLEHWLQKANSYTSTEALQFAESGHHWNWRHANQAFARELWEHYEYHQARLDGDRGWILTWLNAFYRWFSVAKLIDRERPNDARTNTSSVPASLDCVLEALESDLATCRATRPRFPLGLCVRLDFMTAPPSIWRKLKDLAATYRPIRCQPVTPNCPVLSTIDDRLLYSALCSARRTRHTLFITIPTRSSLPADPSAVANILWCDESYTSGLREWASENDQYDQIWISDHKIFKNVVALGASPERIVITNSAQPTADEYEQLIQSTERNITPATPAVPKTDAVRIRLEGEFFAGHSFANINEQLAKHLATSPGIELCLTRLFAPFPSDPHLLPNIDRRHLLYSNLAEYFGREIGNADVVIRHAWPPNWTKPAVGKWVHIQPWEYGRLPAEWRRPLIEDVDEVWVMSEYVRNVYLQSGIPEKKLHYVPWGVDPAVFHPYVVQRTLPTAKSFRFLYVGGLTYRKGFDRLLTAYLAEFRPDEDVILVIKDVGSNTVYADQSFRQQVVVAMTDQALPSLLYYDREMTPGQLASLYAACDCLVAPYRGEGFGLPIVEAMAVGRCPIIPNLGPALDYTDDDCSLCVSSHFVPINEDGCCAVETEIELDVDELRRQLRSAYEDRAATARRGTLASTKILREFSWDRTIARIRERLQVLSSATNIY